MSKTKHTLGLLTAKRDISERFNVDCALLYSDTFCLRIPATTGHDADEQWVNAQFIVRACNVHDDLLEACKLMKSVLSEMATNADVRWDSLKAASIVDSAIAKAEPSSNP